MENPIPVPSGGISDFVPEVLREGPRKPPREFPGGKRLPPGIPPGGFPPEEPPRVKQAVGEAWLHTSVGVCVCEVGRQWQFRPRRVF